MPEHNRKKPDPKYFYSSKIFWIVLFLSFVFGIAYSMKHIIDLGYNWRFDYRYYKNYFWFYGFSWFILPWIIYTIVIRISILKKALIITGIIFIAGQLLVRTVLYKMYLPPPGSFAFSTCIEIQSALASYAADSRDNLYPLEINSWSDLVRIASNNGATLKQTEKEQGITFQSYMSLDTDGDGVTGDDYYCIFWVPELSNDRPGSQIEIRPSGTLRQTR